MRKSNNFELNLVEGNDIVNPLVQDVPNYEKIDTVMKENRDLSVSGATELKTGTVHTITRENPSSPMFRFVATSKFTSGETFTVDGMQVTALLPNGETLSTGAYVIGANVLCCLTGTTLTIMCGVGGEYVAYDSNRLGGKEASEYATYEDVEEANEVAQSAQTVAASAVAKLPTFKNFRQPTNDHMVFKTDSGLQLLGGSSHTKYWSYDEPNACYTTTITFEEPFLNNNLLPMVTIEFPGGMPNACVQRITSTSIKIGCSHCLEGLWVKWLVIGTRAN